MSIEKQIIADSKVDELRNQLVQAEYNLSKWERVNQCETSFELSKLIMDFADVEGNIQGRSRKFNAEKMTIGLRMFMEDEASANILTREFGIRQQAIFLKKY